MDKKLNRLARTILKLLNVRGATLDIFLLPNREIAALKKRFLVQKNERRMAEPNVLAFPEPPRFPHPDIKKSYLGEVYLNKNILKKSPERTAPLLLHGMLHLLGYDHKKIADAAKMEHLERKILAKMR